MLAQFAPDEIYPSERLDRRHALDPEPYASLDDLLALPPERRAAIRVYCGHFPYCVREQLGLDLVVLTLLRDPVERTISVCKHFKDRYARYHDAPLPAVYDDELVFRNFIENYQTRMFALTPGDDTAAFAGRVPYRELRDALEQPRGPAERLLAGGTVAIDDARFERAQANLAQTDVVGLCEHYTEFVAELRARFAWWPNGVDDVRANVSSSDGRADAALRRRIESDNRFDGALYQYARELVVARRG
jgi:hypothetical protein